MEAAMSSNLVERNIVIGACFLNWRIILACSLSLQCGASSDFNSDWFGCGQNQGWPGEFFRGTIQPLNPACPATSSDRGPLLDHDLTFIVRPI
jgi:hypothetical protein